MSAIIDYRLRGAVDDRALSALHHAGFATSDPARVRPWRAQLERHSLTWVQAYDTDELVGFVNVCWDGGGHAFLLDTAVDPSHQHRGIGAELVRIATEATRAAGCEWLHVDYEPHLSSFYLDSCGFRPTGAGLINLRAQPSST